jgi:hypothetical protein
VCAILISGNFLSATSAIQCWNFKQSGGGGLATV